MAMLLVAVVHCTMCCPTQEKQSRGYLTTCSASKRSKNALSNWCEWFLSVHSERICFVLPPNLWLENVLKLSFSTSFSVPRLLPPPPLPFLLSVLFPFLPPFVFFCLSLLLVFFQEKAPFDLEQLVQNTLTTFQSSLQSKHLQLILNLQHLDSLLTDNRQISTRSVLFGRSRSDDGLHTRSVDVSNAPPDPSELEHSSDITSSSSVQCGMQLALGNGDRGQVRSDLEGKHQVAQLPQFRVVGDQYRLRQVLSNFISNGMYIFYSMVAYRIELLPSSDFIIWGSSVLCLFLAQQSSSLVRMVR